MFVTTDLASFRKEIRANFRKFRSETSKIVTLVKRTAYQRMVEGVDLNVYNTEPGTVYKRTGDLRRGIFSIGSHSGDIAQFDLGDRIDYATDIEYGKARFAISEGNARSTADLKNGEIYSIGRSGKNFSVPGPYIWPATAFSELQFALEFQKMIVRVWR